MAVALEWFVVAVSASCFLGKSVVVALLSIKGGSGKSVDSFAVEEDEDQKSSQLMIVCGLVNVGIMKGFAQD